MLKQGCSFWLRVFSSTFFSILYFRSIVIVYNSYTVPNNILIKIDGVVYSYIVELTNYCKYYTRNKLKLWVFSWNKKKSSMLEVQNHCFKNLYH